jgi:hypothetical protein
MNRTTEPMWAQLARTRHENEAVLAALRFVGDGPGELDGQRALVAARAGLGLFATEVILRRLVSCGLAVEEPT